MQTMVFLLSGNNEWLVRTFQNGSQDCYHLEVRIQNHPYKAQIYQSYISETAFLA